MRCLTIKMGVLVGMLAMTPCAWAGYGKSSGMGTARKPAQQQQQVQQQPQQVQQPAQPQVDQNAANKARQDVATDTTELNKATVALNALTAKYRAQKLEPTAPYKEAQANVTKAQIAYEEAKRVVTENLKKDPAYQKALADRIKAASDHDALTSESSFDDRTRVAKAMIDSQDVQLKMENAATANDANTVKTKAGVDAATAKLNEVTANFDATLKDIPEWVTASKAVDEAQKKLDTAKKALADAQTPQIQRTAQR